MNVKYLVLGAGISGLSFCRFINDECCILEKEERIGGYCRTTITGDYVWDYAGHFFHFKDPAIKKIFEKCIRDDNSVTCKKNTGIFYKDKYIDYPFQLNIHQLDKDEFIECLCGLYYSNPELEYESFYQMLKGTYGEGISNKFLIPYNEKLYACELEELDENAMGRFFPKIDFEDVMRNMISSNSSTDCFTTYNDVFSYPKKGAQAVVKYISDGLREESIRTKENVLSVDVNNKRVITNSEEYNYEYLINTISFPTFMKLCGSDVFYDQLSWNKVLVFNIGFNKGNDKIDRHWIYFPEKEINFYRVGFYNKILGTQKLSIYVEIGFGKVEKIDIQKEWKATIRNLKKCNIISDHEVISKEVIIMDPAYVHISEKSEKLVNTIMTEMEKENVYFVGRYGKWTYCSMEDCIVQSRELANKLSV